MLLGQSRGLFLFPWTSRLGFRAGRGERMQNRFAHVPCALASGARVALSPELLAGDPPWAWLRAGACGLGRPPLLGAWMLSSDKHGLGRKAPRGPVLSQRLTDSPPQRPRRARASLSEKPLFSAVMSGPQARARETQTPLGRRARARQEAPSGSRTPWKSRGRDGSLSLLVGHGGAAVSGLLRVSGPA